MISCKEIQKLMLEYIEGTLSKKNMELVREHIISCSKCRVYLETLAVTASHVESMMQTSTKTTELPPMLQTHSSRINSFQALFLIIFERDFRELSLCSLSSPYQQRIQRVAIFPLCTASIGQDFH